MNKINIPKYVKFILNILLPQKDKDTILFSYSELFSQLSDEKGNFHAQLWLIMEIVKSIPGLVFSSLLLNMAMTKSYFKLAWRNLYRNKISSLINIFGLAVSISVSLVLFLWIIEMYDRDTFHEKADRIFTIYSSLELGSNIRLYGTTPTPLGPTITEELPQIEKSVRIDIERRKSISFENIKYKANIYRVDEDFFDLFDYTMLRGNKNALLSKDAVIITERFAKIVFGDSDPLNKQLIFSYNDDKTNTNIQLFSRQKIQNKSITFTVQGILKDGSRNTNLTFDCLIPFNNITESTISDKINWNTFISTTFVLLKDKEDKEIVNNELNNYLEISNTRNTADQSMKIVKYELDNLVNMASNPAEIKSRFSNSSPNSLFIIIRIIVALLILAVPSFNFINISIANADLRLKEIGIRKVVGANISQLRKQFLTESLLLSLISIILGVIIYDLQIQPVIEVVRNSILTTYLFNYRLWIILTSILLFTGLSAGGYPALYISRFKPVNILSNNQSVKSRKRFTKILTGTQFVLTFCLFAFTVIIGQQVDYLKNMDKGYNSENIHSLYVRNYQRFNSLANELSKNPNIINIAGTKNHIGISAKRGALEVLGKNNEILNFDIGRNYINTLGLRLKNGKGFNENLTSHNDILINESFAESYPQIVNRKTLKFNNETYNIVGTLTNFHFSNFTEKKIEPVLIRLIPKEDYSFIVFKIEEGTEKQVSEFIMDSWEKVFPAEASVEILEQLSIANQPAGLWDEAVYLYKFFGIMVLVISCIGLFGLVSLHVSRKRKVISIHKVMGSSVKNILFMLNKEYLKILGVSLIIGMIISYFAVKQLIYASFYYYAEFNPLTLLAVALFILAITIATVFFPVIKAATANPVDSLREE